MSVSRDHIQHLADLAHLSLTDAEADRLRDELDEILGHIETLAPLEAAGEGGAGDPESGAAAAAAPAGPGTADRGDEPDADPLLFPPDSLAPDWKDGFFAVPRLARDAEGTP